ncbi:MAG: stage III sporulation protein AF [Eubacteriales bacterium]|nr:stage III sporulation protein AF [Eubacteriales bacterium]
MIDAIKEWVVSIATIMVFVVIIQMIMPSGPIRKIITLVLGLIVIIVVIKPLYKLGAKGIEIEDFYFKSSFDLEKTEILAESRELEEQQVRQIIGVYRAKLAERIKLCISDIEEVEFEDASLIIDENAESKEFGNILSIHIYADKKKDTGSVGKIDIDAVEIDIGNETAAKKENEKREKQTAALEAKIKKKVSSILEIPEDAITVSIGGDLNGS